MIGVSICNYFVSLRRLLSYYLKLNFLNQEVKQRQIGK